jgi:hypothetical protein
MLITCHYSLLNGAVILVILICSTRYLIVKDQYVLFLKERPAVRQERQTIRFARPRQHFFSTFFSVGWWVDPALRQEGETIHFARPRQHFFQLSFQSAGGLTLLSGRKGKLFISLAPVNTFFNFLFSRLVG